MQNQSFDVFLCREIIVPRCHHHSDSLVLFYLTEVKLVLLEKDYVWLFGVILSLQDWQLVIIALFAWVRTETKTLNPV